MAQEPRRQVGCRLTLDRYEWLRRLAFDRRVSMQVILDEAVDLYRAAQDERVSAGAA